MTAASVTVAAQAKVNLVLRVLQREPDGYHRIETVFQRLALADDVVVRTAARGRTLDVEWDGATPPPDLGPPEENLAWRAAEAYRAAAGWPGGWAVRITKRIPAGAGLGGGSSDAAAVLRGLNQLATAPLSPARLRDIGASLGADVAFFVANVSLAIGQLRDEHITPQPPLPPAPVVLVIPSFGISTADAYAELATARARGVARPGRGGALAGMAAWSDVAPMQVNDFEPTVFRAHPDLAGVRAELERAGATVARLSGSGSVVFGVWAPGDRLGSVHVPPQYRVIRTATA